MWHEVPLEEVARSVTVHSLAERERGCAGRITVRRSMA